MYKSKLSTSIAAAAALTLSASSLAAVPSSYIQDFEGMDVGDSTNDPGPDDSNLADDGWINFGNVFSPDGTTFEYGYGPNPSPNTEQAFSGVAANLGEGGAAQRAKYLNIYSDYLNVDHAALKWIDSNTFKEYTVAAADIGKTMTFSFDAKRPSVAAGTAIDQTSCAPGCSATAFIKTIDPNDGYALTNFITADMTAISQDEWGRFTLTIDLSDPLLENQFLQFGFTNFQTNYESSGVYYDNICIADNPDNCPVFSANVPVPAFAIAIIGGLLTITGIGAIRKRSKG